MDSKRLLVVDDDRALRQILAIALTANGYFVEECGKGRDALEVLAVRQPDAVLLDLGLPDLDGLEVTRRIRSWTWVPILVISVQDEERTVVEALDAGADDYLVKPFQTNVLLARLRAVLRRKQNLPETELLNCGEISMDPARRLVTIGGRRTDLTPNEFGLLRVLLKNQGRVVTHAALLGEVWGREFVHERPLLRVHISNLRKKLEQFEGLACYLVNETGVGYRLSEPQD